MQTLPISFIIFEIVVILFSIIIHEISHGFVAEFLGDPTARLQGRLTLNPLKHIDPLGSIIVPILTSLGGFTFGWAKPVPFNPYNLKNRRWGELLIAAAGPASNFLIAFIFSLFIRFGSSFDSFFSSSFGSSFGSSFSITFIQLCMYVVIVNISLAVFNLIPFPPLDGSKVLFAIIPQTGAWRDIRANMERYSIFLLLVLVIFLWQFVAPIISLLFKVFVGF